MSGRKGLRTYPRHLGPPTGEGIRECEASGFVRKASDFEEDVRQGSVAKEFADVTPGFGTHHPQDVVQLGTLNDPSPIIPGQTTNKNNYSKADLGISDQEIRQSIIEGRPPRCGY